MGTLAIMYHRFNEQKYPSTNIQMEVFKKHIKIIRELNFKFYHPDEFIKNYNLPKKEKKILLTIDDGFASFYNNAWPYLKKNKIPFILFISTETVGRYGYMTWSQIKEIEKEGFAYIGNHSHSHQYLVNLSNKEIISDIDKSIKIFKDQLGYNSILFSYPFGEYSNFIKNYVSKNFKFAFGQQSGVIDINKDQYEIPRFPINEKYGNLDRFKFLINLQPLQFKRLIPEEKLLNAKNNPPNLKVEFFKKQKNLNDINCFSNEANKWDKTKIIRKDNILGLKFRDKFLFRRGRVNCSLKDNNIWRWFGVQFSIEKTK
jgi:peptidoglycan/xylan/chitin deacetylase (PgdA/CDA1 family)